MKTGSEWNGWTAEKYLGQGSFGKVYKMTREEFGHRYESALKVIQIPRYGRHGGRDTALMDSVSEGSGL